MPLPLFGKKSESKGERKSKKPLAKYTRKTELEKVGALPTFFTKKQKIEPVCFQKPKISDCLPIP